MHHKRYYWVIFNANIIFYEIIPFYIAFNYEEEAESPFSQIDKAADY